MIRNKHILICLALLLTAASCKIENDIPYPLLEGNISAIEVEGQCDADGNASKQAAINKASHTVQLYVDDTVNPEKLRITRLEVSNNATLIVPDYLCNNFERFPTTGFASLSELPVSTDSRMNFKKPVGIVLRTYQDYPWTLNVSQVVVREVMLENQVGKAVVDPVNRKAVIYVTPEQDLSRVKVSTFNLGGKHGRVVPDPTKADTFDFTQPATFFVSNGWEEMSYEWTVYVYHSKAEADTRITPSPRTTECYLSGFIQQGKKPVVEYKKQNGSAWNVLAAEYITVKGTSYEALLTQLTPATTYTVRAKIDGTPGSEQTFTTTTAPALPGGELDHWHLDDKLWNPWVQGEAAYWDTGNRGAITVGQSNSVPTNETCNGTGQAAFLESRWIVLKFAAGNIFSGSYVKTVGTNGVLSFGQPFAAFPKSLTFHYKYEPKTIDKVGEDNLQHLKGVIDSCYVWVALTDWDAPREIRTRPADRQLFDAADPKVIAFGEYISSETVTDYRRVTIDLNYRNRRTPKYIVVVATSSKYGDYFTGGVGSKLWIDNFELAY